MKKRLEGLKAETRNSSEVLARQIAERSLGKLTQALAGVAVAGEAPLDTLLRILRERDEATGRVAVVNEPVRQKLPDDREGATRKFEILPKMGADPEIATSFYITASVYPGTKKLGEVFLKCDRHGSLASGVLDALAISLSIGLQYGVPIEVYTSKFIHTRFEPSGFTGDKEYPRASSVVDLLGRWLQDHYKAEE